jgi:hypothetical protein
MGSRKAGRHKTKNHAQDGGMLSAKRHQHPAILPWFSVLGWRPSLRFKSRAPCPLRPAAGLLLDVRMEDDVFCVMLLCIIGFETVIRRLSNDDAKTRAG